MNAHTTFPPRVGLLMLIGVFVLLPLSSANAQDPLGGLVLGAALDKFASRVNETIERAVGGGLLLEVQAGGQVAIAIQQAKMAYASSLDLTYGKLSAAQQSSVNSLAATANQFLDKSYKSTREVVASAQAVVHALPFSKNFPQLVSFSPDYAIQDGRAVHLELYGDFYDIGREGFDALVKVGGKEYKNTSKTSQRLAFDIPVGDLQKSPSAVTYNNLVITIPFLEGGVIGSTRKNAEFRIPLMVLPKALGTITLVESVVGPSVEKRTVTTDEFKQESGDDDIKCGGEHADLAIHEIAPDPGWRVIPSTVKWVVTWSQGKEGVDEDWWLAKNCSTYVSACLCVSTEHHGRGTSGKVHFLIKYDAERDTTSKESKTHKLSLGWGDHQVIELENGASWTASYARFDGQTPSLGKDYSDAFLTVSQSGSTVNFRTVP